MSTQEAIGYEAGNHPNVYDLSAHRTTELRAVRDSLRAQAIAAMAGQRGMLPHIERRVHTDIVALCPVGEVLGELMELDAVAGALLHVLRNSHCPQVAQLRTVIATEYAKANAVEVAALGGVQ